MLVKNIFIKDKLAALRECGKTTPPMHIAMEMVKLQKLMLYQLDDISELNNGLISKYGEEKDGTQAIGPTSPGWKAYAKGYTELMELEVELGDPFVIYQEDGEISWDEDGQNTIILSPNVIVDMGDLLDIRILDEKDIKIVESGGKS